jgi:FtsZ-interacting cell division protein ZipA
MSSGEPSPEELLRQIKVDDVLLQTVVTLINLGGRRLTVEEEKDPAQAKQAIDAARALLPLCPQEEIGPIKNALSQLQMVYVKEQQTPAQPAEPGDADADADAAERAKARSKIWTPPGSS